ncbi:PIN-like domain-containing protein, partial [Bernardetia sp.]|uniref:PIN-like domain-containing protein n=1 Tax=Bernardetia sp. TaxID=1937974 RepID=UPI0025BC4F41
KKHDNEITKILEGAIEDNKNMEKNDPLLNALNDIEVLKSLSSEEISFLSSKYKEMQEKYDEFKGDSKNYWKYAFPSCGEKKDKENPMSDFIIFHEILKYSKNNSKNVLFITNDFRKKDWFNIENFEQYTHYVEIIYSNTSQMIFILKGKKVLDISYEKVFDENEAIEKPLREETITSLLLSLKKTPKTEKSIQLNDLEIDFLLTIANKRHSPEAGLSFDNIKFYLEEQNYQKVPIEITYNRLKKKSLISGVFDEYGDFWGYNLSDKGEKWLESYYTDKDFTNKGDDLPF